MKLKIFDQSLGGGGGGGELLGRHAGGLGLPGALLPWRLYQEGFGRRMRNVAASLSAGIANRQISFLLMLMLKNLQK
jgi:hypothetical protein